MLYNFSNALTQPTNASQESKSEVRYHGVRRSVDIIGGHSMINRYVHRHISNEGSSTILSADASLGIIGPSDIAFKHWENQVVGVPLDTATITDRAGETYPNEHWIELSQVENIKINAGKADGDRYTFTANRDPTNVNYSDLKGQGPGILEITGATIGAEGVKDSFDIYVGDFYASDDVKSYSFKVKNFNPKYNDLKIYYYETKETINETDIQLGNVASAEINFDIESGKYTIINIENAQEEADSEPKIK